MKKLLISLFVFTSTFVYSYSSVPVIKQREKLVYQVKPKEAKPYTEVTIYSSLKNNSLLSYKHFGKDFQYDVKTDVHGIPEQIVYKKNNKTSLFQFDQNGGFVWEYNGQKRYYKKGSFSKNVTAENALIARTLNFQSKDKYTFDLIQCVKLPKLETYTMYFQVVGDETVTVKAGKFKCKKVLFSLTGFRGLFYKAYYYISNDSHRYLVKMENMPKDGSSELISIK